MAARSLAAFDPEATEIRLPPLDQSLAWVSGDPSILKRATYVQQLNNAAIMRAQYSFYEVMLKKALYVFDSRSVLCQSVSNLTDIVAPITSHLNTSGRAGRRALTSFSADVLDRHWDELLKIVDAYDDTMYRVNNSRSTHISSNRGKRQCVD